MLRPPFSAKSAKSLAGGGIQAKFPHLTAERIDIFLQKVAVA